jgi:hypothetical protein
MTLRIKSTISPAAAVVAQKGTSRNAGHAAAVVVLAVDVEDREDDQVGEDECEHAAEADTPVPKYRASGTLPIEQTNERIATSGPQIVDNTPWC